MLMSVILGSLGHWDVTCLGERNETILLNQKCLMVDDH